MEKIIIPLILSGMTLVCLGRTESGITLLMCLLGVAAFNGLIDQIVKILDQSEVED